MTTYEAFQLGCKHGKHDGRLLLDQENVQHRVPHEILADPEKAQQYMAGYHESYLKGQLERDYVQSLEEIETDNELEIEH